MSFVSEGRSYQVKKTQVDSASALHAVLGFEIEDRVRCAGEESSCAHWAKWELSGFLKQAVREHRPFVLERYVSLITDYLNDSFNSTPESSNTRLLFLSNPQGRAILQKWQELRKDHFEQLKTLKIEEGILWGKILLEANPRFSERILQETKKRTMFNQDVYRRPDGKPIPFILTQSPEALLEIIETDPLSYLDLIDREYVECKEAIENLRKMRDNRSRAFKEATNLFILQHVTDHFLEKIMDPGFFLSSRELPLIACLYDKTLKLYHFDPLRDEEPVKQGWWHKDPENRREVVVLLLYQMQLMRCEENGYAPERSPRVEVFPASSSLSEPSSPPKRKAASPESSKSDVEKDADYEDEYEIRELDEEGQRDLLRKMAEMFAESGQFAAAYKIAEKIKAKDLRALRWARAALKETATQLQEKGLEALRKRATYEKGIEAIDNRIKNLRREYIKCIQAIKEGMASKSGERVRDHYFKALACDPEALEPHYFALLHALTWPKSRQNESSYLIAAAMKRSHILVFNMMIAFLFHQYTQRKELFSGEAISRVLELFPMDIVALEVINLFKAYGLSLPQIQDRLANAKTIYVTSLAKGYQSIRIGNLAQAHDAWAKANICHLSAKQPYIYLIVLELLAKNTTAAKKLQNQLSLTVDWFDPQTRSSYGLSVLSWLFDKDSKEPSRSQYPETELLNVLIGLYSRASKAADFIEPFLKALKTYLSDPEADLIWAKLVCEAGEKIIGSRTSWYMQATALLLTTVISHLLDHGQDLSSYEQFIECEEKTILIHSCLRISYSRPPPILVEVDPKSTEIPLSNKLEIFKDLLWTLIDQTFIAVIWNGPLEERLTLLLKEKDKDLVINPKLLEELLERIDIEGSQEHRLHVIRWAIDHFDWLTKTLLIDLTHAFCRWRLNKFFGIARKGLEIVEAQWLPLAKPKGASPHPSFFTAMKVWSDLIAKESEKAQKVIDPFFSRWDDEILGGAYPEAVRVLSTVRGLLKNPAILAKMPTKMTSPIYEEVYEAALALMAGQGIMLPYVIPPNRSSKESIRRLAELYLAPAYTETSQTYLARLKRSSFKALTDLTQMPKFNVFHKSPESGWVLPIGGQDHQPMMRDLVNQAIKLQIAWDLRNQALRDETPDYECSDEFKNWVKANSNLSHLEKFETTFKKVFWKEAFKKELESKKHHEREYKALSEKMPTPKKDPAARFWQLVELTATVVENVRTGDRTTASYDLALQSKQEAYLVMQLIYALGRPHFSSCPEKLSEACHGPEIHIWGMGPRIWHYNAGVFIGYKPGTRDPKDPANIHIFFEKKWKK